MMFHRRAAAATGAALWVLFSCSGQSRQAETAAQEETVTMEIASDAFQNGEMIPAQYTCDDADQSPPLRWSKVPEGTKSFALICDDPDAPAGTWVHWVLFNIPGDLRELPADVPRNDTLSRGMRQGVNDFQKVGYGGPCPPRGAPHRYFFKLYALDGQLDPAPGISKLDLEKAMKDRVLARAQLMGKYARAPR